VIVLAGILSNTASDVGYVLLIPLAGIIFIAVDRHPVAGMAAAFAGVSGGFSANLFLGTIDPLIAGLSEEAARIVDPSVTVNPTANYYFMVVSTFIVATAGTFVTEKIIEPRLGKYKDAHLHKEEIHQLNDLERRGLRWALYVVLFLTAITAWGLIPENGFFRGPDGGFLTSPLIKGVVAILFLGAGACGIAYGFGAKKFKSDADVMKGMTKSMESLASYYVLVFFAAQFVAYFKWSNLGVIMAIKGANVLIAADIGVIPLMILFVLLSALINMLMGSASAKWAIMAPIFIPMFMLLGFSPELSQVVYRIGDSVTNVISPMMSFFALIIAFIQKYDKQAGIGTIIATMLPYSVVFFIAWTILLIIWLTFGLPLGPGAGLEYTMPQ
jgi:aminobenzoyl-glutamate transport protein